MKTTYNTNICFLTQIIQTFLFIQYVRSLQLTCPDVSQWNIRAKGFCNNAKPSYYCLFDKNSLYYKEFCRHKEDFHQSGNKYIVRGDIDGEPCEKTRYQPFKFRTEGNSKCIFQKSACSEDGQIIHNNGNTTSDITCRCDYTRGYGFVIKPKHTCFCYPTEEDCSCYKKKCNTNELLNPMAFLSVVFIRFIKWSLQKCNTFTMMEDIILRKVEEGIAQYTERLHNDIYYQQINDWKIDDNKFIVTKTTNEIYDRLQRDSCVLVVGRAGCHKSSIVRHIALKMQSEEQYDIIPIFTAGSIFELINQRRNQIFVVDDFCGKVVINSQSVDVWYSHMDEILKLIHNVGKSKGRNVAELKFLFATRLDVYDELCFQKLTGFTKYVYQLSDRPLTDDEKLPIIKNYFP